MNELKHDLSGMRVGRWMLLAPAVVAGSRTTWHAMCDCGNFGNPVSNNLLRGVSRSCGCLQREAAANITRTNQAKGIPR